MERPGMILVHARLLSDDFSVDDLTTWYETKQRLRANGMSIAARDFRTIHRVGFRSAWRVGVV